MTDETQSVPVPEPAPLPEPPPAETQAPEPIPSVLDIAIPESQSAPPTPVPAAPISPPTEPAIKSYRTEALEKRKAKKQEKLERIIALATHKKSIITNNDVQLLLGVSDATATRYLSVLVTAGRLKRIGAQKRPSYEPA